MHMAIKSMVAPGRGEMHVGRVTDGSTAKGLIKEKNLGKWAPPSSKQTVWEQDIPSLCLPVELRDAFHVKDLLVPLLFLETCASCPESFVFMT